LCFLPIAAGGGYRAFKTAKKLELAGKISFFGAFAQLIFILPELVFIVMLQPSPVPTLPRLLRPDLSYKSSRLPVFMLPELVERLSSAFCELENLTLTEPELELKAVSAVKWASSMFMEPELVLSEPPPDRLSYFMLPLVAEMAKTAVEMFPIFWEPEEVLMLIKSETSMRSMRSAPEFVEMWRF